MDFNYTEDQLAIADVAMRIFSDLGSDDQVKHAFAADCPMHRELWAQLAESGLLGAPLAELRGGSGLGLTEICLVIEAQGRLPVPIPLIETVVECAMPIDNFAGDELRQRVVPGVVSGEMILSAVRPYVGLQERPTLVASNTAQGWTLNGSSAIASYAPLADGYLVCATLADGAYWVGYCDAGTPGLTLTAQKSNSGEAAGYLSFDAVAVAEANVIATGAAAAELLEWQAQRTYTAVAAQQVCLLREGLQRAAEYTNERKQFGRSLSSFQAVAQQAADAYMVIEALRGVYWRALDDIDNGGDASMSSRVAKYWTCEAGHIAAHIILHVHGGIGQDLDYPVHRYFTRAKKNELYLGGATQHARALGEMVAADPQQVIALAS